MTGAALAGRNDGKFGFAITFAIAFVILLASRRWWQKSTPRPTLPTRNPSAIPAASAPAPTASLARRPRILLINASLNGKYGNNAVLLAEAQMHLAPHADVQLVTLATHPDFNLLQPGLEAADAFLIATGTHWDSWSSVLQKFLEDATPAEGTALWLGKPAAVLVTEHSTGGKGVLSRLQGVLITLGCFIPPMSGLVLSRSALIAVHHDAQAANDFWCRDDLGIVCQNLVEAAAGTHRWKAWPVDRTDFTARWLH
jgi:multimeric flavodoxin WrbA